MGDPAMRTPLLYKLYQYYHLSCTVLFAALWARFTILLPLVGRKFLPGGIHEYLCYLLAVSSAIDIVWIGYFYGLRRLWFNPTLWKDLNFIYFVGVLHFHDDYEHAPVLKNTSYSTFILTLSLNQSYHHWCKMFKRTPGTRRRTIIWKFNYWCLMPVLYISEFILLLLNVRNPNFHSTPWLDRLNQFALVVYLPVVISIYKYIY